MFTELLLNEFKHVTQLSRLEISEGYLLLERGGVICRLRVDVFGAWLHLHKMYRDRMLGYGEQVDIYQAFEMCYPDCWQSLTVAAHDYVNRHLKLSEVYDA